MKREREEKRSVVWIEVERVIKEKIEHKDFTQFGRINDILSHDGACFEEEGEECFCFENVK